jgi:hypothetical protein
MAAEGHISYCCAHGLGSRLFTPAAESRRCFLPLPAGRLCCLPGCFVRAGTCAAYLQAHHPACDDARSIAALCTAALRQAAEACPERQHICQGQKLQFHAISRTALRACVRSMMWLSPHHPSQKRIRIRKRAYDTDSFCSVWHGLVAYSMFVYPIKYSSISFAHLRPSVMAQTTRDWPRCMSPAVKTFSTLVL